MTIGIVLQFAVVLSAIWMGAHYGGAALGFWSAVGLLVSMVAFGVEPTSPPIDLMLIILAVIMAAFVTEAAGGIDFLVSIAERIIHQESPVRNARGTADELDLHVRREHRPYRLSAAARNQRGRAPERPPTGAANGDRDHRIATGDHGEFGRGRASRHDRFVPREGADRVGNFR